MRTLRFLPAWLGLAGALPAQGPSTVGGVVIGRESRLPVEGARVAVLGTALLAESDSSGRFMLINVPGGVRVIQVRAVGYNVTSWLLELSDGQDFRDTFALDERIYTLEAVTARADASDWRSEGGFDRRRARGDGFFITREDITQRRATNVADLMRSVPGLITTCRASNCRVQMMRSTRQCQPEYFLDGYPATFSTGANFPISISSIRGIEVYRTASEAPSEFQRVNLNCGVIAIWTINPGERFGQRN